MLALKTPWKSLLLIARFPYMLGVSFQLTGSLKVIVTQLALANGMGTATVSEPSRQRSDGGRA